MAMDRSGCWTGSEAADLGEFLRAITERRRYLADTFIQARCSCGSATFTLAADEEQGCASRTCAQCGSEHLMLDSAESWEDAAPKPCKCLCEGTLHEVGVGFSHRKSGGIRWVILGVRCVACGILGSPVDWKIHYEPSAHLYEAV